MKKQENSKNEVIIYKDDQGPAIKVNFDQDTVWLTQSDMAELFQKDVKTVSEHIRHIYAENELDKAKTRLKQGNSGITRITTNKPIIAGIEAYRGATYYNLDVIISVGYRVKSKRGTQFRIWATGRLRDYLLKGYAVNKQRLQENSQAKLKELQQAMSLIQTAVETKRLEGYEKELLNIITDYANTWVLLNQYDHDQLVIDKVTKRVVYKLDHEKVTKSISRFKDRLLKNGQASDLFGREQDGKLQALLGNIEQTYDGKPLYQSMEEKAAHLLYFAIKDHPFTDGNKRIGSLLFLLYLVENHRVYNKKGERLINDNALTALALLVAESRPDHKDVMVRLIVNLISKK
jgi:prophage maintenance system killer protein